MTPIRYGFVPMGSVAEPAPHCIYLDVGNRLVAGVIDHHQGDAPDLCTAALVLRESDAIREQVEKLVPDQSLEIVTHRQPDLDAITAVYLVEHLLAGDLPRPAAEQWAEAVCEIDRGHTRLDPAAPITPYSVFLACLDLAERGVDSNDPDGASLATLEAGKQLVGWILTRLSEGQSMEALGVALESDPSFAAEARHIRADLALYRGDLTRAERIAVPLPRSDAPGSETVPGLWLDCPESTLFKAWARGDDQGSGDPRGFVFTGVQLSPTRFILSVQPGLGLSLDGLGEALEAAETEKRKRLGKERQGDPRPEYGSPDPWYDGRSPLHRYTIVDAPHGGTVLDASEVRAVFDQWVRDPARWRKGCEGQRQGARPRPNHSTDETGDS